MVKSLTELTKLPEDLCRDFLKELFAKGEEVLLAGGEFVIDGVGSIKVADGKIDFQPCKELACAANHAFDCFERVELSDDLPDNALDEAELDNGMEKSESDPAICAPSEDKPVATVVEEKQEILPPPVPEEDKLPKAENVISTEEQTNTDAVNTDIGGDGEEGDCYGQVSNCGKSKWSRWISFGLGFASSLVICLIVDFLFLRDDADVVKQELQPVAKAVVTDTADVKLDSVIVGSSLKQDTSSTVIDGGKEKKEIKEYPIYYKVTKTAYLSNVSRKYYGHYAFWIYIYIENKDIIEDPDNIPTGIVLRIPSPEKYGIDKNDPNSIRKAEMKAVEILGGN